MATFAAGLTINYGKFKKRISNQKILLYGDWADPIAASDLTTGVRWFNDVNTINNKPELKLFQNHPNPFNAFTVFQFYLPEPGLVRLEIVNILGQKKTSIIKNFDTKGIKEIKWKSNSVASGIYFYKLVFNNSSLTKKMFIFN